MIDDNPQGNGDDGAIVSEEDTMGRLTDILEGEPATDNAAENEVPADDEPEGDDEADEAEDDAEGEESEDSEDDAEDEEESGTDELKGGQFAPRSAKVRLPDGSTKTVDQLIQGQMLQSDYSRKTEAMSREREEVQATRERFNQATQEIERQRQFIATALEQMKPQPPENPQDDPMAWVDYQQREHAWNQWVQYIGSNLYQSQQQLQQQLTQQEHQEVQRHLQHEQERLYEAIPAMRDPANRQRIGAELVKFGSDEYGFTPEEIAGVADHRMVKVLFDLRQAKARSAKAPEAVQKVKQKPKVVRGSNRNENRKNNAKRSRIERLRETGSARDAEAALMDLDL